MRIVFYSSNSNVFNDKTFLITVMPGHAQTFTQFCSAHPEHDFFCLTQKPAMFLPQENAGLENVIYLPQPTDTDSFVNEVAGLKPDLAIAMTFWIEPYDWLTVSDALIAQKLESLGIKTLCNSLECGLICFDKWRTHNELARLGFDVAPAVFCDHDLYFCAGSNKEVLRNVYKESLLAQVQKLKLPLIIKDTTGLSSYGMTVANTYGEVAGYLNSKRNNSNRLIEEFITGRQFGLEIYGVPGAYQILPPFEFTVNQYGITSPKLSFKYGPCPLPEDLKKMMLELAEKMKFKGVAQVDLILDESNAWHIIEINPRLSGMSYTYASACGLSVFEMIYRACITKEALPQPLPFVMSLKLPLMSQNQMKEILELDGVTLLNQTNDLAAKQEREKGFCECIICCKEKSVLQNTVSRLKEQFPQSELMQKLKDL